MQQDSISSDERKTQAKASLEGGGITCTKVDVKDGS